MSQQPAPAVAAWTCPVCGGHDGEPRYRVTTGATEQGVDPDAFRPSTDRFGVTTGTVLRCRACGHGALDVFPPDDAIATAYEDAADPVSLREEAGQVETARRALTRVELQIAPATVVDIGCWTGSFLVAAAERGWDPIGIEPSAWASERARARGIDVRTTTIEQADLALGSARLVVMADVLEHLAHPGVALDHVHRLLEPDGVFYATVPDAGSRLARVLGRRWWSVLPMHVQYFTRTSFGALLRDHGLEPLWIDSHAKVFTARYYAERLAGYVPGFGRAAAAVVDRTGFADRLVAPDFRDRMAVLACKLGG